MDVWFYADATVTFCTRALKIQGHIFKMECTKLQISTSESTFEPGRFCLVVRDLITQQAGDNTENRGKRLIRRMLAVQKAVAHSRTSENVFKLLIYCVIALFCSLSSIYNYT